MKSVFIISFLILLTACGKSDKKEMVDKEAEKILGQQYSKLMEDPLFALNLDSVKSKYGNRFMELRTIVNEFDPIGLIDVGAPEDEYDPEVKTIIVQLEKEMTEQDVHNLIYQEFLRWFEDESTAGPKDSYKELAKEIHEWN